MRTKIVREFSGLMQLTNYSPHQKALIDGRPDTEIAGDWSKTSYIRHRIHPTRVISGLVILASFIN